MNKIKYNVLKAIYESSDEASLFEIPIDVIQNHSELRNVEFPTLLIS